MSQPRFLGISRPNEIQRIQRKIPLEFELERQAWRQHTPVLPICKRFLSMRPLNAWFTPISKVVEALPSLRTFIQTLRRNRICHEVNAYDAAGLSGSAFELVAERSQSCKWLRVVVIHWRLAWRGEGFVNQGQSGLVGVGRQGQRQRFHQHFP